jgi:hypothetical protein
MTSILGDVPKRFMSQLESDLFGGNTTTATSEPSNLTYETLERLRNKMFKPMPVAVWFIDRMSAFYRFKSMCKPYSDSHGKSFHVMPMAGLHIYCWKLHNLLAHIENSRQESIERFGMTPEQVDESHGRTFPVREPGVWVVWNTGDVQEIEVGSGNDFI